ncbi:MAG: 50S ribosomal protein L21 [Eudoraea sp.]|uniref:50S ribosomal protein L21 n=1 Tax=Eudoraea sp. TaxID=1979955 RepID=UPI003C774D18
MYAIVEIAGQQFKVAKDQKVYVHRLQEDEGKKVSFHNVLLLEDGKNITIGAPAIDGAAVEAKVVKHLKGDKVIVFKKKRRKGFRKKNGHRQYLTELVIESIVAKGAKKTVAKAEPKKEAPVKPAPVKVAAPKTEAPKAKVEKAKEAPKAKVEKAKEAPKVKVDLSKKTVAELKEMAKAKGISGISSMKKADLIEALNK